MDDQMITEADVASFRHKLNDWAATLSDGEQAILQLVAVRAFPDPGPADDVSGFDGKGASSHQVHDLHITRLTDKASPVLMMSLHQFVGQPFGVDQDGGVQI